MWVLASFTNNGAPAVGLNPLPVIRIRDISTGALVVADVPMAEVGDGFYAYDFSAQDVEKDYAFRCDGGSTLSDSERYTFGSSGQHDEVIDDIHTKVGSIDVRSDLIKKIQINRLELADGDTSNWVLYDDDDVTPLLVFSVRDKNGNFVIQTPHTPSRRSKAVVV